MVEKATVTQITTRYNQSMQNTTSEHTDLEANGRQKQKTTRGATPFASTVPRLHSNKSTFGVWLNLITSWDKSSCYIGDVHMLRRRGSCGGSGWGHSIKSVEELVDFISIFHITHYWLSFCYSQRWYWFLSTPHGCYWAVNSSLMSCFWSGPGLIWSIWWENS